MRRRWWLWALLLALLGMNVIAFFHAWRFTHFMAPTGPRTQSPERVSTAQKLALLLTGVRNPKPVNEGVPSFPYRSVFIQSPNGRLAAWYSSVAGRRGTVALFHGYTSNKSKLVTEAAYFRRLGYAVLLVDFAGSGGSEGYRTTVGYREAYDVAAVVQWLQRQPATGPLVLYGPSMGAVAILRAESELGVRPAANIVECPYGSMLQTAQNRFAAMHVPSFPMAHLLVFWGGVQNGFWAYGLKATDYATHITTPTLLLWGEQDARVTRAETDAVFRGLRGPKQRQDFALAGHEPYWRKQPALWQQTVAGFLATIP
ncbi:lysophospholipase [Hymenobacter profundi]|uniref:Lysophospholipase n=2 Tax=Hymenobacter profundi TaxID=1982110 RepID=A0ABS6WZL7_9BACT|nr:lysophospholipase [Hymenobacter profundi]